MLHSLKMSIRGLPNAYNKAIYRITANSILCDALDVEGKLLSLVSDYYKDSPDEAGKTDTEFYRHMSLLIDSIERSVYRMRTKLENPELIQGYETV